MIELSWKETTEEDYKRMMVVSNLLAWLTTTLAEDEANHSIKMNGYIVLCDSDGEFSTLIICEGESQKKLLKILQQPPEEYKEKYVACVLSKEPEPVKEKCEDDESEDEGKVPVEIEET